MEYGTPIAQFTAIDSRSLATWDLNALWCVTSCTARNAECVTVPQHHIAKRYAGHDHCRVTGLYAGGSDGAAWHCAWDEGCYGLRKRRS
jgi:hypothetical protein